MINFEKEILCERLKGCYEALSYFIGSFSIIEKQNNEILLFHTISKNLAKDHRNLVNDLKKVLEKRDSLIEENIEIIDLKTNILSEREKLMKNFKEKFKDMRLELNNSNFEIENLKGKNSELEKKYSDVSEELKKIRNKAKVQFSRSFSTDEEKYCSKCQKAFRDVDNYNWSCRVHKAKLQNNIY